MMGDRLPRTHRGLRWSLRSLGLGLLLVVLATQDWADLLATLRAADLLWVALTIPVFHAMVFFKVQRWRHLLRTQQVGYPPFAAYRAYLIGIFWGYVTPGRLGDFARVLYLRRDVRSPFALGLASILMDRLADLGMVVAVAAIGLLWLINSASLWLSLPGLAVITLGVLWAWSPFLSWGSRLVERLLAQDQRQFTDALARFTPGNLLLPAIYTLLAYGLYFLMCYCVGLALDLGTSYHFIAICVAAIGVAALLPLSIGGFGSREALLAGLFATQGLSTEAALAYALLFFVTVWLIPGLAGLLLWQLDPIDDLQQQMRPTPAP
ncbi:MAG: flippase-like domain-containing protein [Anaerolineae bacterium]|nr:flippase-like domain-containing protein [Anaerolineae bacterium]